MLNAFSCRDTAEKADERQKPANAVNEEAQVVREILASNF